MASSERTILDALFLAARQAADPAHVVPPALPPPPRGRTIVVGAGKAAASMARAVEKAWPGPLQGLVVTRYGHGVPCERIEVVEAAHPVPDAAGFAAARRILDLVGGLGPDDLVLALISGGGSALLALPAPGIPLDDKRAVTSALLRSGATIGMMNAVRKHLSAIKGGRLALAAYPAPVVTLAISDVPGDDPGTIASGPTVGDSSTLAEARALLAQAGVAVPESIRRWLDDPAAETPDLDDPRLAGNSFRLVATPQMALEAAADAARRFGVTPLLLGDALEGEAREVGLVHAGIARSVAEHGHPIGRPAVLLSGGETTVTVRGSGRGGRNVEFLLGLALGLDGQAGIHAIACDTDGIDGTEDNAGAWLDPATLVRARAAGIDPRAALARNDAYGVFAASGDLVITGPTLTNVNDFRAVLIT
ncbi:MAG TPA: glycerate kinase [Stellaceae bacterium]|nr:glycerate kinase [Stellaceae bacterium]